MSTKKLYSVNGRSVQIYKDTKGGKRINYGFTDMDKVVKALRQPGPIVVIDQFSDKNHGIKREEAKRLVALWADDIAQRARIMDENDKEGIHPNCFRGIDN